MLQLLVLLVASVLLVWLLMMLLLIMQVGCRIWLKSLIAMSLLHVLRACIAVLHQLLLLVHLLQHPKGQLLAGGTD